MCHSQVSETAKFCSECGIGLTPGASDTAWIVAMQEKIKHAKENDLAYTIFGMMGAVTAIVIPFTTRFVLRLHMDMISWLLTIVGILFFIGGYVGTRYDHKKVKELTEQLEQGQK
jgi:hypothetical protein